MAQHSPRRLRRRIDRRRSSRPQRLLRLPQLTSNQNVQYRNQRHRSHEEDERRNLERMREPIRHDSAKRLDLPIPADLLLHTELDRLRDRQAQRHRPNGENQSDRPRQLRHRVRQEGMTDRQVALDREGGDRQYGRVGGRLRRESLQDAERLAEDVRVR